MKDDSEIVNSYAKGFLLGAIIGGAVGAVTALLFAPKPGKELREELSYRSKDLIEKGQEYFAEKDETLHSIPNEAKIQSDLLVKSAREKADDLMQNAEQMLKNAKGKSAQTTHQVTESLNKVKEAAVAGVEAFKQELHTKS